MRQRRIGTKFQGLRSELALVLRQSGQEIVPQLLNAEVAQRCEALVERVQAKNWHRSNAASDELCALIRYSLSALYLRRDDDAFEPAPERRHFVRRNINLP